MLISELAKRLPGGVRSRRIVKEDIGLPERIMFLEAPGTLRAGYLYLLDAATAATVLPGCAAPSGSTVLCAGELPNDITCQVNINLLSADCGLPALYNAAADYLAELQRSTSLEAERLQKRFASIVESSFPDDLQVENVCATFPKHIRSSYCLICVEPEDKPDGESDRSQLFTALCGLFAGDNVTVYDNNIVIIHSYDGFTHPPKLPLAELSALLKRHGASAGVSNGIRKPSAMRLMYIMACKSLECGKVLWRKERNVYFYDDAMLYTIMSLAAAGFEKGYDSDDIILLCSPIVVNLMKHDPGGKRELLETLFQYILNGRSTSKTAEAMHMHRNTVQNRISLIEEITGKQFSRDGMLQAKVLITYYAIQYYTKVQNKNLVLSPLQNEDEEEKK